MPLPKLTNLVRWTLLLLVTSGATDSGVTFAQERSPAAPFDFKGRLIVSVSDADMLPSAYIDGKLGPVDGADALSIIRLDRPGREMRAVETPVSNSVTGPSNQMNLERLYL